MSPHRARVKARYRNHQRVVPRPSQSSTPLNGAAPTGHPTRTETFGIKTRPFSRVDSGLYSLSEK